LASSSDPHGVRCGLASSLGAGSSSRTWNIPPAVSTLDPAHQRATKALARQLVAAGIEDRPMAIRCRGLDGTLSYRSFHTATKQTYEEGDRPLRRVQYRERPEGLFLNSSAGQKCVSSAGADDVAVPPARGDETASTTAVLEMWNCDACGAAFRPARAWSRFCSPACRLRAHRRLARDTRTQKSATISEGASP
jgi:hypothetical protein